MNMRRKPTLREKVLLKARNMNPDNWLVVKKPPGELHMKHRHTSARRVLKVGYVVLTVASLVVTVPLWYRVMFAEPIVVVEGDKQPLEAVMVAPGDTLWGLAKEFYPDQHTGKVVEAIRELNPGIDPGKLQVGQWIRLPKEVR
jgi:LysM repeat protein